MPKDPASGNGPAMSRRDVLTASAASTASMTLPHAATASTPDPVVVLYSEWLLARHEWRALAELPGNGDFDTPEMEAAFQRECNAEDWMVTLTPTTLEGIASLVAVYWARSGPSRRDPEEYAQEAQYFDNQLLLSIWKACTGQDGYPLT